MSLIFIRTIVIQKLKRLVVPFWIRLDCMVTCYRRISGCVAKEHFVVRLKSISLLGTVFLGFSVMVVSTMIKSVCYVD